jgi:hypothetical protein
VSEVSVSEQSLLLVAIGVVSVLVVLLAVGPRLVTSWFRTRRMADPVEGTLQVTASSGPSGRSMYTNYRLHGVVTAPGLPATPVEHTGVARNTKWPYPGTNLPVLVDRRDPTRLRIRWDRLPTSSQTAASYTERVAQALREPLLYGVVTGARDVPTPPGEMPTPGGAVELTLEVTRADGTTYTAVAGALFSTVERRHRLTATGTRLPVRPHPTDPFRVVIDAGAMGMADLP